MDMMHTPMKPIYVRTDKNGTKIYHDYNCPRCSGYGQAEKWRFTGLVCYECGGSGRRATPKIVKEYTPEYWAKLEARRQAKAAKEAEEKAKYAEEHPEEIEEQKRKLAEWRQKTLEWRFAENGCGKDGIGYVLKGNTYKIKDQIKKNGGKWIYGVWVCPVKVEGKGVLAIKIDLSQSINEYGCIPDAPDVIWEAANQ